MFSLRTLGGLSLTSADGPVPSRANQRRRLALLAVLAAAHRRPLSRDKLTAIFWPDTNTERARHLLADSLYVLRDSLGEDVFTVTGDDVALNHERVASDVVDFANALQGGDLVRAVGVYADGGPLLDGVFLSDAPEFERWAELERQRLASDYRRALEQLANEATAREDAGASADWWRRLAGEDPLSSRVALGLMRALASAGDRAGALEFARVHATILRTELDTTPDPTVVAFAEQLRAGTGAKTSPARLPAQTPAAVDVDVAIADAAPRPPSKSRVTPHVAEVGAPAVAKPTRRLAYAAGILILALSAYGALSARRGRVATAANTAQPSIVVLPLVNVNVDAESESFADGMTEELIDELSRIRGLRVISRTSAFAFKGHHTDPRHIAESLHVASVLEGSVYRAGSQLRLSVRLVDGRDGSTRWAETYQRDMKDVFAVQSDIGRHVASALQFRLLAHDSALRVRQPTRSLAAYDLYVRGRNQRELRTDAGFKAAITAFRRAIAEDSSFAVAYAALSEAASLMARFQNSAEFPRRQLFEEAEVAAQKALALDETAFEGHVALAGLRLSYRIDLRLAEREFKRALALNSGDRRTHEYLALLYEASDRPDSALAEAQRAELLDPLSVTAIREVGRALFYLHRYDESLVQLERARTLGSAVRTVPVIEGEVHAKMKMFPQAIEELRSSKGNDAVSLLGHTLARAGNVSEASRILADLTSQWHAGTGGAFPIATVYAGLGDFDHAFAWLDRAFDDNSLNILVMDPTFDDLRADSRFARVRARMGLQ